MGPELAANHRLAVDRYLQKRQLYPFRSAAPVAPDLGMVVVIPCLAEPALTTTLASLADCHDPDCALEVLVVINHPDGAPEHIAQRNRETRVQARDWHDRARPNWPLHLLDYPDLPARTAGVGLARKLGLDEAAWRLARSTSGEGVLVFLDADCTVSKDYLQEIDRYFRAEPHCGGATVAFEHPLEGAGGGLAIAQYELHLRYYVAALRHAGLPDVLHTVGSCLACRSTVYARQGGMNRRQAGEDYYFVQKLTAAVSMGEINRARVFPSPRSSWRVPFGTGKAIAGNAACGLQTYDPRIFADLAQWVALVPALYQPADPDWLLALPESIRHWLVSNQVQARLDEVRRNTASQAAFTGRLFRWFNAFRCLKYVHAATHRHYPKVAVEQAAATLLAWQQQDWPRSEQGEAFDLLHCYRQLQNGPRGLQESAPTIQTV